MKTYTSINSKKVGSGFWSKKTILGYVAKKQIELKSIDYITHEINYGFDYRHIDTNTFKEVGFRNSDFMRTMLGK